MRLKSAPRTLNRASKSLFELTPGSPWTERSGSSASTLARFLASLPPSTSVDGLSCRAGSNGLACKDRKSGVEGKGVEAFALPIYGGQWIVGQHAGQILGVVPPQHKGRGAFLPSRFERAGLY